jgi:hypothetical protein
MNESAIPITRNATAAAITRTATNAATGCEYLPKGLVMLDPYRHTAHTGKDTGDDIDAYGDAYSEG